MKELPAFARRIPGFDGKSFTDKIEIFAWYLHEILGKAKFTAVDVAECFDVAHSAKPANVHSLLGKLCEKKPVRMLRDTGGYRLTGGVRDQIGRNIGARATSVATTALLAALVPKVTNVAQQTFLTETITCFNQKAYRATIVMAWNLAYAHVCDVIHNKHAAAFDAQRKLVFPKLPPLSKRTDFEDYKESQVIEICRGARILDASVCKVLSEKLNKRNSAAHPSSVVVTVVQAEDVITDLLNNVVLNPSV
jgi:hypothetical protein